MTKSSAYQRWKERNPEKARISNRDRVKRWRKAHPEKAREIGRRYYKPERARKHNLHKLGLSVEQYELMHSLQRGKCKICREPERITGQRLAVDHCHKTKRVRGLLCSACNQGLGRFRDNPELLRRAAGYLE